MATWIGIFVSLYYFKRASSVMLQICFLGGVFSFLLKVAKIMRPLKKENPLITKQISCLAHPQKSSAQSDARLCLY